MLKVKPEHLDPLHDNAREYSEQLHTLDKNVNKGKITHDDKHEIINFMKKAVPIVFDTIHRFVKSKEDGSLDFDKALDILSLEFNKAMSLTSTETQVSDNPNLLGEGSSYGETDFTH